MSAPMMRLRTGRDVDQIRNFAGRYTIFFLAIR